MGCICYGIRAIFHSIPPATRISLLRGSSHQARTRKRWLLVGGNVLYIYIDRYKVCSCYPGDCIRGQKNQCSIFGICHQLECNGICKHLDINGLSKYMYIHSIMEPTSLMEYNGIYKHLYRQLQVDNMYVSRQYNGIQKHKSNIYASWLVLLIFDFFFLLGDPGWQVYHLPSSSQP